MHGPAMPLTPVWMLVLLCAASGAYCLLRARRADGGTRGAAAGEAVMGFGMAAMAVPAGTGPWGPPVLLTLCCGAALHALWLLRGGLHHVHHLVGSLAMAYMALAMAAAHGHGRAGLPAVTGALLVYYAGYVLLGGARLVTAGGGSHPAGTAPGAEGGGGAGVAGGAGDLTPACRLAMGTGMLAMLLAM
ncbi:DUF5134 domain-containing protein [Streptomyces sp. NBC_00091]|uniref:DUF5134 domain-containing protein n=1 Tax=Streptomyces sp. NBC_00091 TaxID=2975648 RepID=UPI00225C2C00|nr:DUF5134 domain-containing protein [Streptomyces sp. NBC_00091]MCX5379839.1 DUF5134 domain-containing protein [Streptomyces sp. NBC_00091]